MADDFKNAIQELQKLIRTLEQESRATRKIYKKFGVTETQGMVLRQLDQNGPESLNGLSRYFYVTPSNMTGIIDRLEVKGLVNRQRQNDRRIVHIHLSSKGSELSRVLPDPLEIKLDSAFSDMSAEEVEDFTIPVRKLLRALNS